MVTRVNDASNKWFYDGIVIGQAGSYSITGASAHLCFTNGNWYFMGGSATLA